MSRHIIGIGRTVLSFPFFPFPVLRREDRHPLVAHTNPQRLPSGERAERGSVGDLAEARQPVPSRRNDPGTGRRENHIRIRIFPYIRSRPLLFRPSPAGRAGFLSRRNLLHNHNGKLTNAPTSPASRKTPANKSRTSRPGISRKPPR